MVFEIQSQKDLDYLKGNQIWEVLEVHDFVLLPLLEKSDLGSFPQEFRPLLREESRRASSGFSHQSSDLAPLNPSSSTLYVAQNCLNKKDEDRKTKQPP